MGKVYPAERGASETPLSPPHLDEEAEEAKELTLEITGWKGTLCRGLNHVWCCKWNARNKGEEAATAGGLAALASD